MNYQSYINSKIYPVGADLSIVKQWHKEKPAYSVYQRLF